MDKKIYSSDIIAFLFFHISIITLPWFESYNMIKYLIIAIVAIYLFSKINILFRKKYRAVNLALLFFSIVVLVTGYINKNEMTKRNTFLAGIVFVAIIVEAFLLFQYIEYKNKVKRVLSLFYYLTLSYVIATDIIMLLNNIFQVDNGEYYLIGNKFTVSYIHLLLCCLYWFKCNKHRFSTNNRVIMLSLCAGALLISIYMDTATGIVGCFLLLVIWAFHKKLSTIISIPIIPIICLCVACTFFFVSDFMSGSIAKFLVVDVLGKDLTMTGRMGIYLNVFTILPGHWLSGYGHGSTYEICMNLLGAPNTQNGLMEILVQYGVIGLILFLILIYIIFKRNEKTYNIMNYMPIMCMIYIYIILASVEITLELSFFVLLATLTVCLRTETQTRASCVEESGGK